ncbi:unnamed protein product [Sphagnum jensenii]|uniref:Uncharacterized protein n=1 Tax=Sphagnum jensenii TaxID=128206 RepID=A0ABP0W0V8_9BRYO
MSCGASFRLASNILSCTYDVMHNPVLRACSRHDVANYIKVVCVVNLQRIARHLRHAWAFSIALDSATHQSTSYLDVDSIVDEADEDQRNELFNDIASVYVIAYNRISELSAYSDENNNLLADPSSFPLVLPHELVKLSAAEFIRKMRRYSYRLEQHYSSEHIDIIVDEHKQLLHAYRTKQVLKQNIDALSSQSAFKDGWSLFNGRFSNLMEFYGVITTLFPGTNTVEFNFSILRWEKDAFHKSLSNFGHLVMKEPLNCNQCISGEFQCFGMVRTEENFVATPQSLGEEKL